MVKGNTLTSLPVEIIERIVAKCHENDLQALEGTYKPQISRARDPAQSKDGQQPAEEPGWETEEEGEDIDDDRYSGHPSQAPDMKDDEINGRADEPCFSCGITHPTPIPLPSLHSLAMTSKFFRELALPYIYESVDFEALPNSKIRRYIDVIIPKYGHLVKDLWLRISNEENAEFMDMDEDDAESDDRFGQEARYGLALELLKKLTHLTGIDIDATESINQTSLEVFEEIAKRHDQLGALHLTADVTSMRLSTTIVAPILLALPKLVRLELSGLDRQSSIGENLRDVIAKLPNLRMLDLADCHCVVDDWAEAEWQCQLTALELDDCQNISTEGVEALIQRHARTLQHLTLTSVPYQAAGDLNKGKPYDLPELRSLSLDNYDFTFELIWRFAHCAKLTMLDIGTLEETNPKQLAELIEKSRSTTNQEAGGFPALRDISLSSDWPDATQDPAVDGLELICFEHGITLDIEPPDSDDEEDDDDVSFEDDDQDGLEWDEGFTDEDEEDEDELDGDDEDDPYDM